MPINRTRFRRRVETKSILSRRSIEKKSILRRRRINSAFFNIGYRSAEQAKNAFLKIQMYAFEELHQQYDIAFVHRQTSGIQLTVLKMDYENALRSGILIQNNAYQQLEKKDIQPKTETEAAIIIQRVWRRHIDMQVYKYYKDLINFKTRGNPAIMLRCINPNEAKILDAAAGISVRFRLAGERFPPNIYYKIFTKRPIQDLCANSPKDYTKYMSKSLTTKDTHSNVRVKAPVKDDQGGWYKRIENNGWRLVSDRLIHHIMNDPVTWETSKKEYKFDHSRMQRRQDVERRKKKKKIEWMQKMYKDGLLRAKTDDIETIKLIEGAAAGMIATVEASGPDALEDWEVDELLDWTTTLNFDEYRNTWTDLATSAASHKIIEEKYRLSTNLSDPFEFSLSSGPSRFTSARQSHVTPVTMNSADSGREDLHE